MNMCTRTLVGMWIAGMASAQSVSPKSDAKNEKHAVVVKTPKATGFDVGGDLRLRYDGYDNLPSGPGKIDPGYADVAVIRTRVWGKYDFTKDFGIYARIADEFRVYHHNDDFNAKKPKNNYNRFPDEVFIDNLYMDINNIADLVSLRIGRQDMKYGAKRIISDGTPSDGTRSAYFNAAKATFKVTDKTSSDVFAIYSPPKDQWPTLWGANKNGEYDYPYYLTSPDGNFTSDKDDDLTEWAVGNYWTIQEQKDFPVEAYAIWKDESRWYKGGQPQTTTKEVPGRHYVTLGTRLNPKLTDTLSAEFEGAYQAGRTEKGTKEDAQNISAFMLYGGVTYQTKEVFMKPYITPAVLFLSGDDDRTAYNKAGGPADTVTGWNPVFARETGIGNLPVKMYGSSYRWSNLIWPYGESGITPLKGHAFKVQSGPMFAVEDDTGLGSTTDKYRGWYTILVYEATLIKGAFGKRGDIKSRLQAEQMVYGDYQGVSTEPATTDVPCAGYYLRAELSMSF